MEVVDDGRRVGQQARGADRRGIDRGRVDGHELDPGAERVAALREPVDDRGTGAALPLPEQALGAGQVDEPGVPGVDSHPPLRLRAALPPGLSAASLIDSDYSRSEERRV